MYTILHLPNKWILKLNIMGKSKGTHIIYVNIYLQCLGAIKIFVSYWARKSFCVIIVIVIDDESSSYYVQLVNDLIMFSDIRKKSHKERLVTKDHIKLFVESTVMSGIWKIQHNGWGQVTNTAWKVLCLLRYPTSSAVFSMHY